jgi:hypothetical protein
LVRDRTLDAVQAYCEVFLKLLDAKPRSRLPAAEERVRRVLSAEETATRQDARDDWHRGRDPAAALFAGWFGKPWAERLANEVLFPRGLAAAESAKRKQEGLL